jgi:hypothetical protein
MVNDFLYVPSSISLASLVSLVCFCTISPGSNVGQVWEALEGLVMSFPVSSWMSRLTLLMKPWLHNLNM